MEDWEIADRNIEMGKGRNDKWVANLLEQKEFDLTERFKSEMSRIASWGNLPGH